MDTFALSSTLKDGGYPHLPYKKIKDDILGSTYVLSLVFIGAQRAHTLNVNTRGKTYVPNVLSFPLTPTHGEIFITPSVARKEAHARNMTYEGYIGYLFIHGLLHLKGHAHGDTMEKAEARFLSRYNLR